MVNSNDEDIIWYAFQCPKTKREYFYEPISGEKTWTLPTSKSTTTNPQKKSEATHQVLTKNNIRTTTAEEETDMGVNSNPPVKLGLVIMMTLAVSLILNTVFLVVLVKFAGSKAESNPVIFEQPPTDCSKQLLINTSSTLLYEESDNEVISDDVVEENESKEYNVDTPKSFVMESNDEADTLGNEEMNDPVSDGVTATGNIEVLQQTNETLLNMQNLEEKAAVVQDDTNIKHFQENNNMPKSSTSQANGERPKRDIHANRNKRNDDGPSSEVPPQCWVPFAYVFNPRCRRNHDAGLKAPMFDAEQFVRAMI
jgi:hypothetical protein